MRQEFRSKHVMIIRECEQISSVTSYLQAIACPAMMKNPCLLDAHFRPYPARTDQYNSAPNAEKDVSQMKREDQLLRIMRTRSAIEASDCGQYQHFFVNLTCVVDLATCRINSLEQFVNLLVTHLLAKVGENCGSRVSIVFTRLVTASIHILYRSCPTPM